jgi:hypothetical protein
VKRVWVVAVVLLAALFVFVVPASAGPGDTTYAACSTDKAVTTDQYGIQVVCTEMVVNQGWVWAPVLRSSPLPSVVAYDTCAIAGRVGLVSGSTYVCVRAFNGFAWVPLSV